MDTSKHNLESLFNQLGLANDNNAIQRFIQQHRLKENITLDKASFWTPAQAQFIRESWETDADWVDAVDHLDTLLRD